MRSSHLQAPPIEAVGPNACTFFHQPQGMLFRIVLITALSVGAWSISTAANTSPNKDPNIREKRGSESWIGSYHSEDTGCTGRLINATTNRPKVYLGCTSSSNLSDNVGINESTIFKSTFRRSFESRDILRSRKSFFTSETCLVR